MKFITEEDLRREYDAEVFAIYIEDEHHRLTPGGRQYLLDRGVTIERKGEAPKPFAAGNKKEASGSILCSVVEAKLASCLALFLKTYGEVLRQDILLGQQLAPLYHSFATLLQDPDSCKIPATSCGGCSEEERKENRGICFPITDLHLQLKKGMDLLSLHYLRANLLEVAAIIAAHCTNNSGCTQEPAPLLEHLHCLINALNLVICKEVGGTECQR